jgi:hypothetical protein
MIQRVSSHPRGLWFVTYNHATAVYSLVDAWKGEVATSDSSEALAAAVRLLTGSEPFFRDEPSGLLIWIQEPIERIQLRLFSKNYT